MGKTNIKVEFRILGEDFNPDSITDKLTIKPNYQWINGDRIENKASIRKYSCWAIHTEYEESYDVNDQLNKVMSMINKRKLELIELKKVYDIEYRFDIIVNIENNEKPAIYLNSDTIEFANDIKAEFDFDLYIF